MGKSSLQEFLQDRALLAIKISSRDLAGLFTRKFTIPLNTAGLAIFEGGAVSLFPEHAEVSGRFDLVLAKVGDVQLRFVLPELRSQDGFLVTANLLLTASVATGKADLFKDFTRMLFNMPGTYSAADLKGFLLPEVRKIITPFVGGQGAESLHKRDRFPETQRLLADALERHLFGGGVALKKISEISFAAPDFEKRAAAEAKRGEDQRREKETLDRKEERVKRLAAFLQEQQVQDLLGKIPDERLKGLLYAKLMEDDTVQLTAQDLLAKAGQVGGDMVRHIYRAMEGLLGTGTSVNADDLEPENAEQILVAIGSKVLALDPEKGGVTREFSFKDPLRSVRSVEGAGGPLLLAGSKRSIHSVPLGNGQEPLEYPLSASRSPKGGVNAIAAHGGHYYATHSEYGVARWKADKAGVDGELIFEDLTARHKTTRAAQVASGYLMFATGPKVYAVALGNGMHPIEYDPAVDGSPVTSVAAGAGAIFAGTESGAIVSWTLGEPDRPSVLVRKREPIVNLRIAKVSSIPHLFYTSKDFAVRARVIGQSLETSYESGGSSVGVLDAASDLVAASDGSGRRVLMWKATSPARPVIDLDATKLSDKPVLDLWLKKVKAH